MSRQTAVASAVAATVAASALVLGALHGPVQPASGRLFYVSPAGADGNSGTSLAAPYRTISACAAVAQAGDSCLLRAGTYHETVAPTHDGTAQAPITFKPYKRERVTIDGADPVTGWIAAGGDLYTTSVTLPYSVAPALPFYPDLHSAAANQVFFDDRMLREAQWPSAPVSATNPLSLTFSVAQAGTTYALSNTAGAVARIVDAALPITTTDMTGAIVHYWGGDSWWSNTGVITAQGLVAGTPAITYTQPYPLYDSYYIGSQSATRYYIVGASSTALLDAPAEWAYLPLTHTLALRPPDGDDPAGHVVAARRRLWTLDLSGRSNITVAGLVLHSGGVLTDGRSTHDTLDGLDVRYPTHMTVVPDDNADNPAETQSGVVLAGYQLTLRDSTIAYSAGAGVSLGGRGNSVVNTLIHDSGYLGTLGSGISLQGTDAQILHSTIYNTAGEGIDTDYSGTVDRSVGQTRIAYNDIFNYGLYQADQGALYQCCDAALGAEVVDHNWVHDCRAQIPAGTPSGLGAYRGNGLYFDNGSHGQTVHHNVLWATCILGIATNASGQTPTLQRVTIANNTFADGTTTGVRLTGSPPVATTAHSALSRYANNLYLGAAGPPAYLVGATVAGDVVGTGSAVQNAAAHDYRLRVGSSAVDAGVAVPGITDAAVSASALVGPAPDAGAYEYGAAAWSAGCTLAACAGVDPAIPPFTYQRMGSAVAP